MTEKSDIKQVALATLGIVYGDIGTSPLYTLKACFLKNPSLLPNATNILGLLSLIFWSLILIVSVKYLAFVFRATDRGEGGILTLANLAKRQLSGRAFSTVLLLGLLGASFFYGEVVITPAMSVLSAIQGMEVLEPEFKAFVVPLACVVLTGLFYLQRRGTAKIGVVFGPIMLLWFLTLSLLGVKGIILNPHILRALDPVYALVFLGHDPWLGFLSIGFVVLAITGTEALYADMGHFGPRPIRYVWFLCVLPALVLNYFGQGALLLSFPHLAYNPFFHLAPTWSLVPLIILSTLATVVASQAVISGIFSLTRQAIQQGYLPHLRIKHTSDEKIGQIYVPSVNRLLFLAVLVVTASFRTSGNLAAAYGLAVTGTMVVTSSLFFVVALKKWRWSLWVATPILLFMLALDLPFFFANVIKIPHGGWLPLVIGFGVFTSMTTWRKGSAIIFSRMTDERLQISEFVRNIEAYPPLRVNGIAIFLAKTEEGVPRALLHNLKHNKVLHKHNYIMIIKNFDMPYVKESKRLKFNSLSETITQIVAYYGFKETPNLYRIIALCKTFGLVISLDNTSFFLSRERILLSDVTNMRRWRKYLYIWMTRNALRAMDYFKIPTNRVVELGTQIKL